MATGPTGEQSATLRSAPVALTPLFRAKTRPPTLPTRYLPRPAIREKLRLWQRRRVTTVVAPAGAGKSTLLADFASTSAEPVYWYTIDDLDVSDQRLLTGLSVALRQPKPAARTRLAHLATIVDALDRMPDRCTLVVDDVHQLTADRAIEAMTGLLRYLPPSCHVILAGRSIPDRLHAMVDWLANRGQVGSISWSDLQLSAEEQDEAAKLFVGRQSCGWILSLAHPAELDLGAYIESEVLSRIEPSEVALLRRLAILPSFDADLAARVLDLPTADATRFVESMRASTPLLELVETADQQANHPVYRLGESARGVLAAGVTSDERAAILIRAGRALSEVNPLCAAECFLDAGEPAAAADALDLLPIGSWFTQAPTERHTLLERLEEPLLLGRPNLLVARTSAMSAWQGRHRDALVLLDQTADWAGDTLRAGWGQYVRARALLALGRADDARDAYRAIAASIREARAQNAASVPTVAALICRLGTVEHLLGEPDAALTIETGLEVCETTAEDTFAERLLLHHTRGFIAHRQGDLAIADRHIGRAIELCARADAAAERASLYHIQAGIARGRGEFGRSLSLLESALREPSLPAREKGILILQMAHTLCDLADFRGASRRYRAAASLLVGIDRDGLYPRALAGMVICYAQLGLMPEADARLLQLEECAHGSARHDAHLAAGVRALCRNDYDAAAADFDAAAGTHGTPGGIRDLWQAHLLRAQANLYRGEKMLARAAIADGLELFPGARVPVVGAWIVRPIAKILAGFAEAHEENGLSAMLRAAEVETDAPRIKHALARADRVANDGPPAPKPASFEIRLLGTPSMLVDGSDLAWPYGFRRRAIEAFWYLAARREGVPTARLAADLMPDTDEQAGRRAVRVALSDLRAFLGRLFGVPGETIVTHEADGKIMFQPERIPGSCLVDLHQVNRIADELKSRRRGSVPDAAVDLFRGEFMAGWEVEWVQPVRRYWTSLALRVLGSLARRAEEGGRLEQAIRCYQRVVELDPTIEAAHAALMRLYDAAGDRPALDSQMWLYTQTCKDDLDAEPGQVLKDLYQALSAPSLARR